MRVLVGHTDLVVPWTAALIPHVGEYGFGPWAEGIGVVDASGELVAGCVYHDYQDYLGWKTMQLSMAAVTPRWAQKGIIRALLHYPFAQAGVDKLWTITPVDLHRAIRLNLGLGFKREAVLRHQFGRKRHGVICSMLKTEWANRWKV
jgi:RimJ/RimL family protein N-acetyltransferase